MGDVIIKPIETHYKGYRFRSRLEARWAVFFDAFETFSVAISINSRGLTEYESVPESRPIEWMYELQGYDLGSLGRYLPDFWLPELECFAEVKPKVFTRREWEKCRALKYPCLLLDGVPAVRYYAIANRSWREGESDPYEEYLKGDNYGRVDIAHSIRKHRLWFAWGEEPQDVWQGIESAVIAARSARFEFGEQPSI